jgi:predicted PurR-regulated permease PerM
VVLTLGVTAAFLTMIQPFLMALLLAAITASMIHRRFEGLARRMGGRRPLAAIVTILVVILVLVFPLVALIGVVTAQAIRVAETVTPWAQEMIAQPDHFTAWVEGQPVWKHVLPYEDQILQRMADLVSWLSSWAVDNLSSSSDCMRSTTSCFTVRRCWTVRSGTCPLRMPMNGALPTSSAP